MEPAATHDLISIDPKDIIVSERLRAVDEAWVEAIAASIEQKGQDTPIQVRRNGGGKLHLVAGGHRLEACRQIGVNVRAEIIECTQLEARLIEIDENLFRRELGALDRAVFLAERKAVYEEMYPETGHGKTPGNQHSGQNRETDILSFSQSTADHVGLSSRSIERAINIATNIPVDVRQRLVGTTIADRQVDLLYLASLDPDIQRKAITLFNDGATKNLKQAVARSIGNEEPELSPVERHFQKLLDSWAQATDGAKKQFLQHLGETGEMEVFNGR